MPGLSFQRGEVAYNSIAADVESARRGENEAMAMISKRVRRHLQSTQSHGRRVQSPRNNWAVLTTLYKSCSELNSAAMRRDAAIVRAPVDGNVVRLLTLGAGETVKTG